MKAKDHCLPPSGCSSSPYVDQPIRRVQLWDYLGMGLSGLCLIHCLSTPLIAAFLPFLSHKSHSNQLHLALFLPLLIIASVAFWRGYQHHKRIQNLFLFVFAMSLLLLSLTLKPQEPGWNLSLITSIFGSLLLILAHYWNRKFTQLKLLS